MNNWIHMKSACDWSLLLYSQYEYCTGIFMLLELLDIMFK